MTNGKYRLRKILRKAIKNGLLFCAVALSSAANAEMLSIVGVGTHSCGKYIEFRHQNNQPMANLYQQWGAGYLAGNNVHAVELETITAWADKWCSENPLATFIGSIEALKKTLMKQKRENNKS